MGPSFENKIIILTGAGSGIGRATAIKLASLGGTCALQDINPSALTETQTLCSNTSAREHFSSAFDVSSTSSATKFVADVIAKYGKIDHIFNCAGINPTSLKTEEISDEYWDRIMNVNLKGMFNITRAVIPHLKSGASFVNVASVAGIMPTSGFAVYCASKYGVVGFSKCVALELGSRGIRCNIVAPGSIGSCSPSYFSWILAFKVVMDVNNFLIFIDTPTNASVVAGKESVERNEKGVSMGRLGTPEEVADVVAFLFSEESRYMNGSVVEITGGLLKGL
jgi:NAD(P)-dependent dehydrogenase (short-subunit alcohol dehydrogenase family)